MSLLYCLREDNLKLPFLVERLLTLLKKEKIIILTLESTVSKLSFFTLAFQMMRRHFQFVSFSAISV